MGRAKVNTLPAGGVLEGRAGLLPVMMAKQTQRKKDKDLSHQGQPETRKHTQPPMEAEPGMTHAVLHSHPTPGWLSQSWCHSKRPIEGTRRWRMTPNRLRSKMSVR